MSTSPAVWVTLERFWEGKQDRHWYRERRQRRTPSGMSGLWSPQEVRHLLGTVTRDAKTNSPTFNRWFAVVHVQLGHPVVLSDPLYSLAEAKAWVEVISRMNK